MGILFLIILPLIHCKILELTKINLPNVLKSHKTIISLFHHPQCEHSKTYHQQYSEVDHSSTVGVVDCSQESNLCTLYRIQKFPTLLRLQQGEQSEKINQQQYLEDFPQIRKTDQFLTNMALSKLKQYPNYIVALFEEVGLPVLQNERIESDRIFYLSEGRLSTVLRGFVGNRQGCWIFQNVNNTLMKYFCGNTYQSPKEILNYIEKLEAGKLTRTVFDASNYENNRIIGYNQLLYKFTHEHEIISNCYLLYVWSESCLHCNYNTDISIIEKGIKASGLNLNLFSYDIGENQMVEQLKIKTIPELVKICPSSNKTMEYMMKLININNVENFLGKKMDDL